MPANRKYILWVIFAALLLYFCGDKLLGVLRGPMDQAKARGKKLQEQIRQRQGDLAKVADDREQLVIWESQSLPADPRLARSLYQAWLVALVEHVGLTKPNVDSNEPVNHKDMYEQYAFTVRGQGTLEQLTQLLFEFYQASHLHQIRTLDLTPVQQGRQFNISLIVEAVSFPEIKRRDALSDVKSDRPAFGKLFDYQVIAGRNVFAAAGGADSLAGTRLTAVTYAQGRPQAWFSRDRGDTLQLGVGDTAEVGSFHVAIVDVTEDDVVVEINGQPRLLAIGETLSQASALPPELR